MHSNGYYRGSFERKCHAIITSVLVYSSASCAGVGYCLVVPQGN